MLNELLAAAIASSAPSSSDAGLADLESLSGFWAQQGDPLLAAADTLLAAAAETHRPVPQQQQQQQQQQQKELDTDPLQQLLSQSLLAPLRIQQQPQQRPAGDVADEDLDSVAQALLLSYPDLAQQLLQLQPRSTQRVQQTPPPAQPQHHQAQQQALLAALLGEPQQQQKPQQQQPQQPQQQPSQQDLIEQLLRGLLAPEPAELEAQLLGAAGPVAAAAAAAGGLAQLSDLMGRQAGPGVIEQRGTQAQAQQQEQDLLLQLAMQQEHQQQQPRPQQQPGLLELLQQQHSQQRNLQQQQQQQRRRAEAVVGLSPSMDIDGGMAFMPTHHNTLDAAAAGGGAAGGGSSSAKGLSARGQRRSSANTSGGDVEAGDPAASAVSPATAAALAPPPQALAALAAAAAQHRPADTYGLHSQQQQQWSPYAPPQDIYSLAAGVQAGSTTSQPAVAAGGPGLLQGSGAREQQAHPHAARPPAHPSSMMPAGGQMHVGTDLRQQQQQQPLMQQSALPLDMPHGPHMFGAGGAGGAGSGGRDVCDTRWSSPGPVMDWSTQAAFTGPHQQHQQQQRGSSLQAVPSGPLSLRAQLGLPPTGLTPQTATALPGGLGEVVPLVRPATTLNHHVVFVWELDDGLVPLHGLITATGKGDGTQVACTAAGGEPPAAAGGGGATAAALGRQLQGLVLQLADHHLHFQALEDVDTMHVSDVWYLAAQYEQRQHRRRLAAQQQQQQQQGQQHEQDKQQQEGAVNSSLEESPTSSGKQPPCGQQPALKRARRTKQQQQQQQEEQAKQQEEPAEALSRSVNAGAAAAPAADSSKATKKGPGPSGCAQQEPASADGSSGDTPQPASNSSPRAHQAGTGGTGVAAQAKSAGAGVPAADVPQELVLRPYRLGPPPDQLQQLWDHIAKAYDAGSGVLPLPPAVFRAADKLYESLDAACGGWLRSARQLLESLSGWQELLVTHVVVGRSQLVPLLAKLLLTRLDGCVGLTQVYAAAAVPKVAAFKRVRAKYGPRARYIVLGPGFEEEVAADLLGWPFVRLVGGNRQQAGAAAAGASPEGRQGPGGAATAARGPGTGVESAACKAAAAGPESSAAVGKPPLDAPKGASGSPAGASGSSSSDDDSSAHGEDDDGAQGGAAISGGGQGAGRQEARRRQGAAGLGAAAVALDALGSRGHSIMDLSVDRLKQLALSMQA